MERDTLFISYSSFLNAYRFLSRGVYRNLMVIQVYSKVLP